MNVPNPDKTGKKQDTRFKPGVSGNPKGRPKGKRSIPDILRKIGEEEGSIDGKTKLDVVMRKVFGYALEGKSWAVQFIADRTEGKAVERKADVSDEWKELIRESVKFDEEDLKCAND